MRKKKYTETVILLFLIRDCYKVVDTHYRQTYVQRSIPEAYSSKKVPDGCKRC